MVALRSALDSQPVLGSSLSGSGLAELLAKADCSSKYRWNSVSSRLAEVRCRPSDDKTPCDAGLPGAARPADTRRELVSMVLSCREHENSEKTVDEAKNSDETRKYRQF